MDRALEILAANPPDVFNHNIETVPDLYPNVRPGADYQWSLTLLQKFKAAAPDSCRPSPGSCSAWARPWSRCRRTLRDLRAHDVDMVTIGQYLQPTAHHHPVLRYWTPGRVQGSWSCTAYALGFSHVASGPLVRSSYHADRQATEAGVAGLKRAGLRPTRPYARKRGIHTWQSLRR